MKRPTQVQILNRRIEMLFLNRKGIEPKNMIAAIALKHKTSEEAVKRDWSKRKEWIRILLKVDDAEALALDTLYDYEVAILEAYDLYEQAEDVKTKLQTLWLRLKAIRLKEDFLREISALEYIESDFLSKASAHRDELFFRHPR